MAATLAAFPSVTISGIASAKSNAAGSFLGVSSRSKPTSPSLPLLYSRRQSWSHKDLRVRNGAYVTETAFTSEDELASVKMDGESESFDSPLIPNIEEIQSLLNEICDDTSIAEVQVKIQGFKLRVKREVGKDSGALSASSVPPLSAPAFSAPPVPSFPMIDSLSVAPAPHIDPPAYESDEEVDEGLEYVFAANVGIFRSGRPRKGKFGRPFVIEGSKVKTGQLVGFIEQLGTNLNVESQHTGEVVGVFVSDGDPIEFGQKLFSIRPSFPGILKLQ